MKNFKSILLVLLVAVLVSSCKKDVDWQSIDSSEQSVLEHKKDETKFSYQHAVWLGDENRFSDDFRNRLSSLKAVIEDNDLIVFTRIGHVTANIEKIKKVYNNGGVVLFVEPDVNELAALMYEHGWLHMYPTKGEYHFYGISKKGAYALQKPASVSPTPTIQSTEGAEAKYNYSEKDLEGEWVDPYQDYDPSDPSYFVKPLIEWVNGIITPYTKASESDDDSDIDNVCEYKETLIWNCDLFVHNCGVNSSDDRIQGQFLTQIEHKYTPLYSQRSGDGTAYGDFYNFNTNFSADPSGVWKGDDFVNKHGAVCVHIKGAFIKNIEFKSYILGDGSNPYFYCDPQPGTDNNKVQYTETQGLNIPGGVTGGFKSPGGKEKSKPSFSWTHTSSSTVSQTVSDVSVVNNSKISDVVDGQSVGSSVAWNFIYGNLPKCKGDKGFSGNCPQSAHSFQSYPTQWVWSSKSQREGSTASLGDLITVVHPVLGGLHNGACVDGEENTWDLGERTSVATMVVPNRIIFGTARIVNDLGANYVMHDFIVQKHSETPTVEIISKSDFLNGDEFEFSLAIGTYDISVLVYDKTTKTDTKYVLNDPYILTQRYSESDIKTIDFTRNFKKEE